VPLKQGEDYEYICALKKEFIGFMKKSPYYIQSNGWKIKLKVIFLH
jgi:hypothetical protein